VSTRKSLANKADRLWREAIWAIFGDKCAVCGKPCRNAHHLIGRRNFRLRWDKKNGINLCPEHHTFSSKFSAHQTPTIFAAWFKERFPVIDAYLKEHVNEIWDKDYDKVFKQLGE
jgi:hypothetical protein